MLQILSDVRNNYGALLHLALEIVKAEDEPDKELLRKLMWIKSHTTKKLNTNYFVVVHTILRRMALPLTALIEVKVSQKKTKEFELGELISELEESHMEINDIIREVAKKYSLDIMMGGVGGGVLQIPEIKMEKT
jgi:hypothetical protein